MSTEHFDVAIIGAGLTGLTLAHKLKKAGLNIVVLESSPRTGGAIHTQHAEGFVFESGPNTGVLSHPEAAELMEELAQHCQIEIAKPEAKRRLIWKGKRWVPLPSGLIQGITTPLFSLTDKFRLLGEPFRKAGTNPNETLACMVRRRMGESFLRYAVDPFILGIYAGDPEYLVPRFALPKLYNLEQQYGSFIGGAIKKGREPKTEREQKATREVFSVKGGLSNLINALVLSVGSSNIRLNCSAISISPGKNFHIAMGSNPPCITANRVVTTTGSHALPDLLPFLAPGELEQLNNLHYAKVAQLAIGFKQWKGIPLNAFGGLVPSAEQRNILGALFPSAFLSNRAPQEGAILSIFTGGVRNPDIVEKSDTEILEALTSNLKEMLGLQEMKPDIVRIFRYTHAIPQYGANTEERLAMVKQLQERYPGLLIAGNLRDGIGMSDRIKQATLLAKAITAELKQEA